MPRLLWIEVGPLAANARFAASLQGTFDITTRSEANASDSIEGVDLVVLRGEFVQANSPVWKLALRQQKLGTVGLLALTAPNQFAEALSHGADEVISLNPPDEVLVAHCHLAIQRARLRNTRERALHLLPIGELTSGIAHEINTPIQYIGDNVRFLGEACTELLGVASACHDFLAHAEQGEDVNESFSTLATAAEKTEMAYLREELPVAVAQTLDGIDRVTSLVRAMKEFVHPGSEALVPCDLGHLIESTVTLARNEWKYNCEMHLDLDSNVPPVPCLAHEIQRVVLNLVINAVHAIVARIGEDSGTKGHIELKLRVDQDHAVIEVADDGCGVPEDIRERIFEPFFTTKPIGKGTGQGLALARSVIEETHGGKLTHHHRRPHGSIFHISLPRGV